MRSFIAFWGSLIISTIHMVSGSQFLMWLWLGLALINGVFAIFTRHDAASKPE